MVKPVWKWDIPTFHLSDWGIYDAYCPLNWDAPPSTKLRSGTEKKIGRFLEEHGIHLPRNDISRYEFEFVVHLILELSNDI